MARSIKPTRTDAFGTTSRHTVEKGGRVIQTDAYGNKRYDKPQYQVKDGKVYATDAYGRVGQQKFEIKDEKSRSK